LTHHHRALAYLAQPYWHDSEILRFLRTDYGAMAAAYLMKHDHACFSPIAHSAEVRRYAREMDHAGWLRYDKVVFDRCDFMLLLPLVGWDESKGVAEEMGWAKSQGKPIFQLLGDLPGIPQDALFPSTVLPIIKCDQYGPRNFPEFFPERSDCGV
jgi:hypothetical protein